MTIYLRVVENFLTTENWNYISFPTATYFIPLHFGYKIILKILSKTSVAFSLVPCH